jgi:hypothetical protein
MEKEVAPVDLSARMLFPLGGIISVSVSAPVGTHLTLVSLTANADVHVIQFVKTLNQTKLATALTSALEMAYVPLMEKEAVLVTCRL